MPQRLHLLWAAALACAATACGDAKLGGLSALLDEMRPATTTATATSTNAATEPTRMMSATWTSASTETNAVTGTSTNTDTDTDTDTDTAEEPWPSLSGDDTAKALSTCFESWGKTPFKNVVAYRTIEASPSSSGGYALEDTAATDEPELILVRAAVSARGTGKYLLMNPNGYYCLMLDVDVAGSLAIETHCTAKLTAATAKVDLGSYLTIVRKKSPEAAPDCGG